MDRSGRGHAVTRSAAGHAHLVGIAGRGLSGLAQLLVERGVVVTGSEPAPTTSPAIERLRRLGVRVHAGHAPGNCPKSAQFLVYAPEIDRRHPERLAAARLGIDQRSPVDWLGRLMRTRTGVAVAGGREAGLTAALIAWTLAQSGQDPTVVLGSPAPQLGGWARLGRGPHCVIEALETPTEFGPTAPDLAIVLDVALERPGRDRADRVDALRRFAATVADSGQVLGYRTNPISAEALAALGPACEWLALEDDDDSNRKGWWGADLRAERGRFRFRAFHRGRFVAEVALAVPGRRAVLSALAALAACRRLDVPTRAIKEALEAFTGLSRDFESRGSYRGVTLVDDEAEEPAAVSETLALGRQVFGSRRLWAVYDGANAGVVAGAESRYITAFATADEVLIVDGAPVVAEPAGAWSLTRALRASGIRARWAASRHDALAELDRHLEPGDVLVTLGTGEVGTIADAFLRRLPHDRAGQ